MPVDSPFGDPVEEIPLPQNPLVKVLCQVRFPMVASVVKEDFIGPFQEKLRSEYPILRREVSSTVAFGASGPKSSEQGVTWRFLHKTEPWHVSLAPTFVTIDTDRYQSRTELLARLRRVTEALAEALAPSVCDRVGLRFINRVSGTHLSQLRSYIRPEILGVQGVQLGSDDTVLRHSVSESLFSLPSAQLFARAAYVPPQSTIDQSVTPLSESSWFLDLDMGSASPADFDVDAIHETVEQFGMKLYRFFRWVVTNNFLRTFGGDV